MIRFKLLLFSACLLLSFQIVAQQGKIRGTVTEEATGEPLIGANILIKGSTNGAVTDLDGKFTINAEAGVYDLQVSFVTFQTLTIEGVQVKPNEVTIIDNIALKAETSELNEVVVSAKAIRTTEAALMNVKRKAPGMIDGISSAKFRLIGDATAVEAVKRVTGVSIQGGKYVYVRGLGDRYTKTTLNGLEIPGLDPDKNSLQMDIFPTNLIDNMIVNKTFTADLPADFTGGIVNVETKDFPEERIANVTFGIGFNPSMHLNDDYITYEGGETDFLGFDDGTRALPQRALQPDIPAPGTAPDAEVAEFSRSFNPTLGTQRTTSSLDYNAGISLGNQYNLGKNSKHKLGYIFSASYKNETKYYDDVSYGEFQNILDPDVYPMRYATVQNGELGERNVLIGVLGGLAYKTELTKIRLTALRLQNAESRAGNFLIDNDGAAVGQSGYIAKSDNLEFNERSLTNILLNGTHVIRNADMEIDWRVAPTFSTLDDPDIRKTAFTLLANDTTFSSGAGGRPTRIWRSLDELNIASRLDITKKYQLFGSEAKLKGGLSYIYKERDYSIETFSVYFYGNQNWPNPDPSVVLDEDNLYPNQPNSIYYRKGNNEPNPNQFNSNVNNIGGYISNEFNPFESLKAVLGVRVENYVQRHTGRDIAFSNGNTVEGRNLENAKVLESLDFFPSANLIYSLNDMQNLRFSYSKTIARPSFKELSFAQIIDPITNRIFNGSLFTYPEWNGNLTETRIDNIDLRWELFQSRGQLFSVSTFYKRFDDPIELVRIPQQVTSTEYQPRNLGDAQLFGLELEVVKSLEFIGGTFKDFNINGNVTFVESQLEMSDIEYESRKAYQKTGQTLDRKREMAGQAPYVINGGLSYNNYDMGLDAGIFYNVKGSTLFIVGGGLFPDVYEEPFHSLNFTINKKFGKDQRTSVDLKISNILNDNLETVYRSFRADDEVFTRFNPGTSISLGVNYKF